MDTHLTGHKLLCVKCFCFVFIIWLEFSLITTNLIISLKEIFLNFITHAAIWWIIVL